MSEYFSGITFPQQKVTPSDDASIRRSVLADGILSGCEISYIGSTLTFGAGLLIGCGRQFRHTTVQNFAVTGATSGFARLVVTIDTTKASTKDNFNQIDAAIEYAAVLDGFTQLRQDDINESGTVYQMQICVVSLGAGGISGIVSSVGKTGGIQSTPKAGFIYPLASAVVPDGFLLCDGAAYARAEYPELFAAIGTMYGSGDGATTFNVPDLRDRVPAGASENHPAGEMVGEETHQLTVEEMPSHSHNLLTLDDETASGSNFGRYTAAGTVERSVISSTGGDQPHNNMQPTTYIYGYIIATGKNTAVSVADIILGAQAIPLGLEYGGVGATDPKTARENLEVAQAIESTEHPGCYYRMVDGEKEWLNPPLATNVEYRTTDRENGKAVYAKRIYFGALPDSSSKTVLHNIDKTTGFTAGCIHAWEYNGETEHGSAFCLNGDVYAYAWVTATELGCRCVGASSGMTLTSIIRYTKD